MTDIKTLKEYCAEFLKVRDFADYCPNGLQVEGKSSVQKIVSGVSANRAFIEKSIEAGADAIFVHHGFFWKNEKPEIIGFKRRRIAALISANISLFAYHLPLDAHPKIGNNVLLGKRLGFQNIRPLAESLVWVGEFSGTVEKLTKAVKKSLGRTPQVFGKCADKILKIAWCSGAAQNFIDVAIDAGAQVYLSGEVSENIPAIADESEIVFISAGHHATERFGVQALGKHLAEKFALEHAFIDIPNSV